MDQRGFGGPNGMRWNVMSPGLKIKATNCSALLLNGDGGRSLIQFDSKEAHADSFCRVRGWWGVWKKKYGKLMVEPTWSEWKAAFNTFPLGGGKTFGQRPLERRVCINCEARRFPPSALFVNALIVPPGFENPVSHHMSPTCRWLSPRVERSHKTCFKALLFFLVLPWQRKKRIRRRLGLRYISEN